MDSYHLTVNSTKYVIKANGDKVPFNRQILRSFLEDLSFGLDKKHLEIDLILDKIHKGIYNEISTFTMANLVAETAAYLNILHPDHSILAGRVAVTILHKQTSTFYENMKKLYEFRDKQGTYFALFFSQFIDQHCPIIAEDVFKIIEKNKEEIEKQIDYKRDFNYDYFGFKTLERSYLLRIEGNVVERPQDLLMRVSIGIHKEDLESAFQTYHLMSQKWFTHATPTLFNAGIFINFDR